MFDPVEFASDKDTSLPDTFSGVLSRFAALSAHARAEKFDEDGEYRRPEPVTIPQMPTLVFDPILKKAPPDSGKVIIGSREEIISRVQIAGDCLRFFEKVDEASGGNLTERFSAFIDVAACVDGDQASSLWQRLYQCACANFGAKPGLMQELGFALLDNGYPEQGRILINQFIDTWGLRMSLGGEFTDTQFLLGRLLGELADRGEAGLTEKFSSVILQKIAAFEKEDLQDMRRAYCRVKFTPEGKEALEKFVAENSTRHISPREFHAEVLSMIERGLADPCDPPNEGIPQYLEDSRCQNETKLVHITTALSSAAAAFRNDEPGLAAELQCMALIAAGKAAHGALGSYSSSIRKTSANWNILFTGDLNEFVNAVRNHPGFDGTSDPERDMIFHEVCSVCWAIGHASLPLLADLLRQLPVCHTTVSLYLDEAGKINPETPHEEVAKFVEDWSGALSVLIAAETPEPFLTEGSFSGRQHTFKITEYLEERAGAVGRALDLGTNPDEVIRTFFEEMDPTVDDTVTTENLYHSLGEYFRSSPEQCSEILNEAEKRDPETRFCLLSKLAKFLPGHGRDPITDRYCEILEAAACETAEKKGLTVDLPIRIPRQDHELSHLAQRHRAAMAALLSKHAAEPDTLHYFSILSRSLEPQTGRYDHMSPRLHMFDTYHGGIVHRIMECPPALVTLEALVAHAESFPHLRAACLEEMKPLIPSLEFDPVTADVPAAEEKLHLSMRLMNLYSESGMHEEAEALYSELQQKVFACINEYQARQRRVENGPGRDFYSFYIYCSEEDVALAEFWMQDLESRQRAQLSARQFSAGREGAVDSIEKIAEACEREVSLRRDRFDPRSMALAAAAVEEYEELRGYAERIYRAATEKIALKRGDEDFFSENLTVLVREIDNGKLASSVKDELLAEVVRAVVPPPGKRKFEELVSDYSGLFELLNLTMDNPAYREARREILAAIAETTADIKPERGSIGGRMEVEGLAKVFRTVCGKSPVCTSHENFGRLAVVSADERYQDGLARLHRNAAQKSVRESDGLTVQAIRAGLTSTQDAFPEVYRRVNTSLEADNIEELSAALLLYSEIIEQEVFLRYSQRSPVETETAALSGDIGGIPSLAALYQLVRNELYKPSGKSPAQMAAIGVLLRADSRDMASVKSALCSELLGNDNVDPSVQGLAFDCFVVEGRISAYCQSVRRRCAEGDGPVTEAGFYRWTKRLLAAGDRSLPSDRILARIYDDPEGGERFLERFEAVARTPRLTRLLSRDDTELAGILDYKLSRLRVDTASFGGVHSRLSQKYGTWVPSLFDESDIILAYENLQTRSENFEDYVEKLRKWYIYQVFQVEEMSSRVTTPALERHLKRVTGITLDERQHALVDSYLEIHRGLPYQVMAQILGRELPEAERRDMMGFLYGDPEWEMGIPETFGLPALSEQERENLDSFLDRVKKNYRKRMHGVGEESSFEVPEILDRCPPLVRAAVVYYIGQLHFGEREAVLADFNEEGLTDEQAVKRFFEVTGNEKFGQFLSLRRDIMPESFRRELESFQEDTEPGAFEEVEGTIEKELGCPLEEVFETINPEPLKAGTIGEVYEGVLLDGRHVAVKVITPGRRASIEANLKRLERTALDLDGKMEHLNLNFDVVRMFREFERTMREELDLRNELRNAEEFKNILPEGIGVPEFFSQYTRKSVLVSSIVEGGNPVDLPPAERRRVVDKVGRMLLEHLGTEGMYHYDLHPGNIRCASSGYINLLDFGHMGRLTSDERRQAASLFNALRRRDLNGTAEVVELMSDRTDSYNVPGFREAVGDLLNRSLSPVELILGLTREAGIHGLEIRSPFLELQKAITTFEGTASLLDPSFNSGKAAVRWAGASALKGALAAIGLR